MPRLVRLALVALSGASLLVGQRSLEFADIIEQREPFSPRLSPDGGRVAFLVRQTSVQDGSSKVGLWIAAPGAAARKILEENFIGSLEWMPDGSALTAALPRPGKAALWSIPPSGGSPQPLFEHTARPQSYAWSPDGARLLFVAAQEPPADLRAKFDREGVVYDESVHGIRSFTQRNWMPPGVPQLWLWRRGEKQAERVDASLPAVRSFRQISWAPNGRLAAVEYVPVAGGDQGHIGVLSLDQPPRFTSRITTEVYNRGPEWHPNSQSFVYTSTGDPQRWYSVRSTLGRLTLTANSPAAIPLDGEWIRMDKATFDVDGRHLLIEYENGSRSTLYRVPAAGGEAKAAVVGSAHFSSFHYSRDKKWAAAIRQSFTEPPEIALIDLESGRDQVLTKLNPQFDSIRLHPAVERRWRNRYGHESNGFLVLPPGFTRARPVPLLVVQYFFSNKFTTQAQWMSSYPVQHFAEAGFAVLLHNYPHELGWKQGDFEGAALSQAYNPLASMEAAVQSLVDEGIADPKRKGILGWSFGAWLAEMAISQSDLFQAASAGEGGLNNAGQYWVTGSAGMQNYLDAFFGGPPFGAAYANYQRLAPALNAHRVKAPLLREYGTDVGVQSLEFYMALRRLNKPVEQIIYPGAPHVFSRPSHRRASMERNLDWFRFWLQSYEDPAPAKKQQYERWRALRARAR